MWNFDIRERRTPAAGLFAPLNATAYVAWLAAASSLLGGTGTPAIEPARWTIGLGALLLFLLGFGMRALLEDRRAPDRTLGGLVVLQIIAALASLWALKEHLQAVLLVLAAAQLPALRKRRLAAAALALANCAMFAWFLQAQPPPKAIQVGLAYVAFQLFAAFVSRAAYQAMESRREVLRANGELRGARALVAEGARVSERLRLSRELHDIAGHKLTALKLHLALETRQRAPGESATLAQCTALADELLHDLRMVVSALRQEDAIDLRTALMALDSALASVSVRFDLQANAVVSDIGKAEALLRCAQEGLTNALRHGAATEVVISLARRGEDLVLRVEDNGAGFSPPAPPAGNGLRGLRERLEEFQGEVSLDRRAPHGCVLRVTLPESGAAC